MADNSRVKGNSAGRQFISFSLGDGIYGLDILMTESIERVSDITRVPKAPKYVPGIINVRGDIIPLVNLRSRLGIGEKQYSEESRIIITTFEGYRVGVTVDKVNDVFSAPDTDIQKREAVFNDGINEHVSEIVNLEGEHVLILDLTKVLDIGGLV